MALFALVSKSEFSRPLESGAGGNEVVMTATLTGPTSYTTGGEAFTQAVIRTLLQIDSISFFLAEVNSASATDVVNLVYDRAANKLIALDEAGTQIANATDYSARTFRVFIVGIRRSLTPLL